ncbi:MAG: hypothetical protein M3Y55_16275 [Pseudomonadota bacterium]|nr:hypothetical protein [Pseudomonadota bacterium]
MWQVAISPKSGLPRFNMPFEAGIAYSLHEGGVSGGAPHHMLLLDKAPYRIQVSMSDAAGIDGRAHEGNPVLAIEAVRGFLSSKSGRPLPRRKARLQAIRAFSHLAAALRPAPSHGA